MKLPTSSLTLLFVALAATHSFAMSGKPEAANAENSSEVATEQTVQEITVTQASAVLNEQGQYQLQWQSSSPVTLKVATNAAGEDAKILAENLSVSEYQWQPQNSGSRYYFILTPEQGASLSFSSRLLPMQGGQNFRDLGGYQTADGRSVKWGMLFRSGVLNHLTETDYQLIDTLGIRTVTDFRSIEERTDEPTVWMASPVRRIEQDYHSGDYSKFFKPGMDGDAMAALMAGFYPHMADQQKPTYQALFDQLVRHDEPMLYHCTAGKDRTGVASLLILTALGVPEEAILQDYLLSNQYLDSEKLMGSNKDDDEKASRMKAFFKSLPPDAIQALAGVRESYLRAVISHMNQQYGGVLGYIQQELGVSEQDLGTLRQRYLM